MKFIKEKKETPKRDIKTYIHSCDKLNILSILIAIISIGTLVFIGVDECKKCFENKHVSLSTNQPSKNYIVYGKNIESGYLKHVFIVLERLGYTLDASAKEWDLLWAHDYPYRNIDLKNLKSHQRVNHFPGCGFLTNKVTLAKSGLRYIPPAFQLPNDTEKLIEFSKEHPEKLFVTKNNQHRHVHVKNLTEINFESSDTFVQEFIGNPLLVDGHMFDIGIYTIITSIDPLRIYIYNGDVLLRFCTEKYYPFDASNLDKYVVGDNYLPTWEVPSLKYYYENLGFGMRESLNAYLELHNMDYGVIWEQIEDSIRTVVLAKEASILGSLSKFKSKRNFFEMMRFDFIVDDKLNVFLMEANMSPNLSSAHFKPNQLLYEQVIFNLFGLVGVATRVDSSSLAVRSQGEELMQSSDKNIAVMMGICSSTLCKNNCSAFECKLCLPCLSKDLKDTLLSAHKEHFNKGDCKRIFPPSMEKHEDLPSDFSKYTLQNKLMYKWFKEKCILDKTWCY